MPDEWDADNADLLMMERIIIDGSYGEGGGQVLRTALTLSLLTGQPFRIEKIRAGRPKPGLQPQHLTCVRAAAAISGATVQGDSLGSQVLDFSPGPVRPGDYTFNVAEERGSAGAITLVLQTILLPLALAEARSISTVRLLGGTHVPWSPPYHYIEQVFLPMLASLGIRAQTTLVRWGFYPLGGGEAFITLEATEQSPAIEGTGTGKQGILRPLHLTSAGRLLSLSGFSAVANLPLSIAKRQRDRALGILLRHGFVAEIDLIEAPASGQGTAVFLVARYENSLAGFSALGARGKPAEQVAEEACHAFLEHHRSGAAVDPHLADQLILPLGLVQEESYFTTSRVTRHLLTNIWVAEQFLGKRFAVEGEEGGAGAVKVEKATKP